MGYLSFVWRVWWALVFLFVEICLKLIERLLHAPSSIWYVQMYHRCCLTSAISWQRTCKCMCRDTEKQKIPPWSWKFAGAAMQWSIQLPWWPLGYLTATNTSLYAFSSSLSSYLLSKTKDPDETSTRYWQELWILVTAPKLHVHVKCWSLLQFPLCGEA